MLKNGINGFCMALADSVPGVSGGTVAFIMEPRDYRVVFLIQKGAAASRFINR